MGRTMERYLLDVTSEEESGHEKGSESTLRSDTKAALSVKKAFMHYEHSDETASSPTLLSVPITASLNPEALPYKPMNSDNQFLDSLLTTGSNTARTPQAGSSVGSITYFSRPVSQASSRVKANVTFWGLDSRALPTKAHTWKSQNTKLVDQYLRLRKLVGFVAPEQFKNPAKPTNLPCQIVPKNVQEYIEHRRGLAQLAKEQMQKNIAWMKAQIEVREKQAKVQSIFGKHGRIYDDGLSPVLGLPTIWSAEYENLLLAQADWPTQSELHQDGDNREQLQTRCGRYLPAPRYPGFSNFSLQNQPFLQALPLDQTGPIYLFGPSPIEVVEENKKLDGDLGFEQKGAEYLGTGLMDEIGYWSPPFIPDWIVR